MLDVLKVPFEAVSSLPDNEAAEALNDRSLAWDRIDDLKELSFADRGRIALEFEKRQLWKYLGFHSFEAWMASGRGGSRTTKYAALAAVKALNYVPDGMLAQMPRCNVVTMQRLSKDVALRPDVIQAAIQMDENGFLGKIEREHPQQHLETLRPITIKATASARKVIDEAIAWAMEREGCTSRSEALALILGEWLQDARLNHQLSTQGNGMGMVQ